MMRAKAADAIRQVQHQIRWKQGGASSHLRKRKRRGHLAEDATQASNEQIVLSVISDQNAAVCLYTYKIETYAAVVTDFQRQT